MNADALRGRILSAPDRKPAGPIDVPEWETAVYLLPLSAGDRVALSDMVETGDSKGRLALMLTRSVCDQAGALVFKADDGPKLVEKSFDAVKRVTAEIRKLNKLGVTAEEAEAEKKD